MKKIEIPVLKRLMSLRAKLDIVSQISWSFSTLNKLHPVDFLTEKEAQEMIESYEELLAQIKELVSKD